MSHPPETSRQLAERIWVCADDHSLADDYPERWKEKAAALIDAWVREREAAAHAAAIQVALQIFREQYQAAMMDTGGDREAATYCGLQAIEKITPADAQRLLDLRIAEAVRNESEWWFRNGNCGDSSDIEIKRQLANNAAVEHLKGGPHGKDEAPVHSEPAQGEPTAAASANSEPGGS